MKKLNYFKKGFSIGEVVLSAFILSFILVIIIGVIATSIRNSIDSRNAIIASELAQEGVELVRNVRDNNWADGNPLTTSFSSIPSQDNCRIDKNTTINCGSSYVLNMDGNNFYVHSSGTATKFQRRIILNLAGSEMTITSFVSWNGAAPDINNCNTGSKCASTQLILNKWGET